jgi:serine/threonine protein kinase
MSERPGSQGESLPASLVMRIDAICDRFEAALKARQNPRIEDYSSQVEVAGRHILLEHLLALEADYRGRLGKEPMGELRRERLPTAGPNRAPTARDDYPGEFRGTGRFAVEERIGVGGMGIVYRAFDRERKHTVAVKTLRNVDATAIYRLKREFRSLSDLIHPNLVTLYELFSEEGQLFFTMEFVQGLHFLRYVRGGSDHRVSGALPVGVPPDALTTIHGHPPSTDNVNAGLASAAQTQGHASPGDSGRSADSCSRRSLALHQLSRLRAALRQLAEGVCLLHQAGKVHRDLKPSNVLVTDEGRVVVLDFGLVAELEGGGRNESTSFNIVGTIPYMSPEQAAGKELTPASDWYSVGVMLFEALTGR